MAVKAELRLSGLQQLHFYFGGMHRVTINAPHVVLHVLGAPEVAVLFPEFVTFQAAFGGFFPRELLGIQDLGDIARLGVLFPWPVTRFASLPFRPLVFVEQGFPVRASLETLPHVLVAGLAGVRADVLRGIGRAWTGLAVGGRRGLVWLALLVLRPRPQQE